MGNIYSLNGKKLTDDEVSIVSNAIPSSIQGEIWTILYKEVLYGHEIQTLVTRMKKDIVYLLSIMDKLPIPQNRKRAIFNIAAFSDFITDLNIPENFLSDKSQEIRTRTYLLSQAYYSSRAIAMSYVAVGDEPSYYKELPNLLFILHSLGEFGISPKDLWSLSPFDSFIVEFGRVASQIKKGVEQMYIQKTPELEELLNLSKIRLVS